MLFAVPRWALAAQDEDKSTIGLRIYLILFQDLPFSLVFVAHYIILNQYYELALSLEVLVNLRESWYEAGNLLMSKRQCINAMLIIVCALICAHFLDKVYYTLAGKQLGGGDTAAYFSIAMRVFLYILTVYIVYRIYKVVHNETFLRIENCISTAHFTCIVVLAIF